MSLFFDYDFEAPISEHNVGSDRYRYTVVYVPHDVLAELPMAEYPRLRISGEVNEYPFEASITPAKGVWYVLFSKRVLKAIGADIGDAVTVRFRIADQDDVDVTPAAKPTIGADALRALGYTVDLAQGHITEPSKPLKIYRCLMPTRLDLSHLRSAD